MGLAAGKTIQADVDLFGLGHHNHKNKNGVSFPQETHVFVVVRIRHCTGGASDATGDKYQVRVDLFGLGHQNHKQMR